MRTRMAPNSALLLFLVKTAVLVTVSHSSSCPSRALCVVPPPLLPPSPVQALQSLHHSLCGCTAVNGSISIDLSSAVTPDSNSVQLSASNFSFLAAVQEITGYLELKGVSVPDLLSLPSLRVIHGRELKNGRALVVDAVVAPAGVIFPELSEIVTGDAYFSGVTGVCGYASVDWSDILSNGSLQEGSTSTCMQVSGDCSTCRSGHCWRPDTSEGESACQTVTSTICPSRCGGNHCFLSADNATLECCDQRCVGGCSGVTASDCFACGSFSDGGECVRGCPTRYVYNSEDHSLAVNAEHKLTAGYFCVNSCPVGLYAKDGVCVADCGEGFNKTLEGECAPLTKQPKVVWAAVRHPVSASVCSGMNVSVREHLSGGNVDSYAGCTVIDGHFLISDRTNEDRILRRITEAQLNGLLSIEEIRGSLIVFNYGDVQLPYLRNVKVIGSHNTTLVNAREEFGDQRASENVAIYIRGNQRLSSIDLSSLQQVVSGDVYLATNDNLCYVPNFSLLLDGSPGQMYAPDVMSFYRRDPDSCAADYRVCHAQCVPSGGCSGPNTTHCVQCVGYRDTTSHQCVSTCSEIQGVYTNESSRTCEPCHEECTACSGPSQSDCTSCTNLEVAPSVSPSFGRRLCVMQCPVGLYLSGTSCEPCSEQCRGKEGCTGPAAVVGNRGCLSCDTVLIQDTFIQCVSSCPPQYYRDVLTSASGPIAAGTAVCRPCSEGCSSCTGPTPTQCSQCTGVGLKHPNGTLECLDMCPARTFPDAAAMCQPCDTVCECCAEPVSDYCRVCMGLQSDGCVPGCSTNPTNGDIHEGVANASTSAFEDFTVVVIVVPSVVVALILLVLVVILVACYWFCKRDKTYYPQDSEQSSIGLQSFTNCCGLDTSLVLTIPSSDIEKQQQLSDGPHASVHKGVLSQCDNSKVEVAIKELKESLDVSPEDTSVAELHALTDLVHYHVVRVYGLSINRTISIISEFVPAGPLDGYLQDNAASVSGGDMLSYAAQVATGMAYLESQQVVHGGLALRNILVHSRSLVKISDVGWAKVVQQGCRGALAPVRWLPAECIVGQTTPSFYSSQSEVWAFGVLLWEVLTYGEYPYADCATAEDVVHQVTLGGRLPRPEACSAELGTLMEKCWDRDSSVRPTFEGLVRQLTDMTMSPDSFINPDKLPREKCVRCRRPLFEPFSIEEVNRADRGRMSPDSGRDSILSLEWPAALPCERLL